jgi:tryptophan synthase alpha chain
VAVPDLATDFATKRAAGRTLLVPYLMAGAEPDWLDTIDALAAAGADAVEVGLPFSDPTIDGAVIEAAGIRSLAAGTTATSVLSDLARREFSIPLVVMSYYNPILHLGYQRFAGLAEAAGVTGTIIPDLSLEEIDDWAAVADKTGIATVMLVAPSTPPGRTALLCERSRGFVYAVARMGVTGERTDLGDEAAAVVAKIRATPSPPPVCVGIGVSTPTQAAKVAEVADGVVVGSALVRRLSEGCGPEGAASFIAELRSAIGD